MVTWSKLTTDYRLLTTDYLVGTSAGGFVANQCLLLSTHLLTTYYSLLTTHYSLLTN